jgi:hypothetical protein
MDPVEPWIDGDAVRRLAAQLMSAPSNQDIRDDADAGFGPVFEGYTQGAGGGSAVELSPSPPPDVMPEPPAAPVVPPAAPVEPPVSVEEEAEEVVAVEDKVVLEEEAVDPAVAGAPVREAASFQPKPAVSEEASDEGRARGPLMERMHRFRDWLKRHAHARSVFVLDRDPSHEKLYFLAKSLSQAYRPVPGQAGNVHVKVGSDAYLVVIPAETDFGTLVLGTVLQRPLNAESVEVVARVLGEAARPVAGGQSPAS